MNTNCVVLREGERRWVSWPHKVPSHTPSLSLSLSIAPASLPLTSVPTSQRMGASGGLLRIQVGGTKNSRTRTQLKLFDRLNIVNYLLLP